MQEKIKELQKAKTNVIWLVNNPAGCIDMHGLVYWSGVVERLRDDINKEL